MNQLKKILFAIIAFLPFLCSSCSDDAEERIEVAKIVESRGSQDLLNDLYLACDDDVESLARILQCTPSSINRIKNGKSEPTMQFEEKIKTIAVFYYQNDRKFSKLQAALDSEYGWYDSILNFPSHHPLIFWGVTIFLFILTALLFLPPVCLAASIGLVIEALVFGVAWIAYFICTPDPIEDKYIDTVNPVIEQLI